MKPHTLTLVTTDDLYWGFNSNLTHISAYREAIAQVGLTTKQIDAYARRVQECVEAVRLIVAELRRRGERVDWEE